MERLLVQKGGFPSEIRGDIEKIESILIRYGAAKVILYGSLARGDYRADSDIDVCYEGIPDENYFRTVAECLMETQRRVSILDFKSIKGYFKQRILREGKLLYELK
ncbi:hypothetical protein AUJ95_04915 [Candidatus Desantisbacteria bacterium CG2_30_40_21]|uniref:Nucleotidyltransferase domain-containing protein n=5 Tax=unclassified Candidatus Desantisiibacteriota TaxID=3106372 RepID=A0A2M7JCV7_9BACT|nr:MAG: hypothetical protein AUJ95_04915 [Candidatus Desantisbacteria bacterium CG2_30_40_21]PIP40873.1 MAG: nucleotidyltransferase [Candidatus Desantisbacteria bacterium CG23_combo_of_CG06-09_8_20_14_all_40_23]PIX17226.1 MAG: nucleotidyltransferase domain-containing protein [Candidatus Desantisbacteria bacterium CG_4_8_14_3_um_filter_40_12]PIY20457.1 MAG: nucleotidyltransferase domain-containing protein [Candidatus Desantisbacteria bacterium CG_4_10_14_3_um_filter_40_18]PJB30383.1 MAG: nucleot